MEERDMQVNQLKLKNFRCFENIQIHMDPHMTVLVGNNATGKSAVLKGISEGLADFLSGFSSSDLKIPGIDLSDIRYKSVITGGVSERNRQFPTTITIDAVINSNTPVTWSRSRTTAKGRTTRNEAKSILEVSKKWQERLSNGDESLILPVIGYYGTERLWLQKKDTSSSSDFNRISGYIDCLDGKSNEKLMLKWIENRSWGEFSEKKEDHQLSQITGILASFFEKMTGFSKAKIHYNPKISELELEYMNFDGETVSRNFSSLSDGYRELMSLVADIAWRMTVLNPQLSSPALETPGVILIDEIELHLHPRWQSVILEVFQELFPKVQFIVTTHSPLVVQSVPRNQLRILTAEEVVSLESSARGESIETVLNDIMDAPTRPKEVSCLLSEFDDAMDIQDWDQAKEILLKLQTIVGDQDSELLEQETILNFERAQV